MTRRADQTTDLDEIRRCTELLETFVAQRELLADLPDTDRRALLMAAGRVSRPASHEARRLLKEFRRRSRAKKESHDRGLRATAEVRRAREAAVYVPPQSRLIEPSQGEPPPARELQKPRNCYVCKKEYRTLHFFYDSMCVECGDFNHEKRFQTSSLDGRVVLITGGRVKIGFQASLMMLRAGARVIATTRFPHDAASRYSREPDFAAWRDRIQIHGLDLRHAPSVEIFARYLCQTLDRLDVILNNAAQTVRRPPRFYAHLIPREQQPAAALPEAAQLLLRSRAECLRELGESSERDIHALVAWNRGSSAVGISDSAALSQVPYAFDDAAAGEAFFPAGRTDADGQQVDLRQTNSWRLALGDVPTAEMLEVHLVNAVAPFILCGRLRPLLQRDRTNEKHIVNVSAMEGVFSRGTKTDKHPHTNMAKSALNMMTLTSAKDYVRDGIFMNAVDTGWVTDEDPAGHADRKREELDFQPPLDIVDGAARICDPVFSGLNSGEHVWGKFLKDYRPADW